ncbi:MAG TPA: hypothetical protein VFW11_22600 [Cyclobacteriaceae bacterium]|nr:hypothetical protein [Cyclobacteriaceae bacterium]
MKKLITVVALFVVVVGASSCSSYTCPTYSKVSKASDRPARI